MRPVDEDSLTESDDEDVAQVVPPRKGKAKGEAARSKKEKKATQKRGTKGGSGSKR